MVDLIIPLGNGSRSNNDELRLLLRSIETYGLGIRTITVVTDCPPSWLQNVDILWCDDPLLSNKDGNIINKVLKAIRRPDSAAEFVWMCDDNVLLQPFDFATVPPTYNDRGEKAFPENGTIWQRRVRKTFKYLRSRGIYLTHNFESHMPHRYPTKRLLEVINNVPYEEGIGFSIDTLFCGLLGITDGFHQRLFKITCEEGAKWSFACSVLGYNDKTFLHGLREALFKRFPRSSKYEKKEGENMACACHGKRGVAVKKTSPYDQCTTCAKKHIVKAWSLFNEFTYTDDNRDAISGQLRNAADHLMYDHRDVALRARDLAVIIEEAKDKELTTEWPDLLSAVRQVYYADHADVADRLGQLEEEHKQSLEEQRDTDLQ